MKTTRKSLQEVNRQAIQLLATHLGAVDTLRFVQQFSHGHGDYTKDRQAWLDDLTLDEIANGIAAMRKEGRTPAAPRAHPTRPDRRVAVHASRQA